MRAGSRSTGPGRLVFAQNQEALSIQETHHAISEELGNCFRDDHAPGRLIRVQWHAIGREFDDRGDRERNRNGPGKPVTGGELRFNPTNYMREGVGARTAQIQQDGHYEVKTPIGQNSISLTGPALAKDPQLAYGALSFDVQPGENEYNVVLPAGAVPELVHKSGKQSSR